MPSCLFGTTGAPSALPVETCSKSPVTLIDRGLDCTIHRLSTGAVGDHSHCSDATHDHRAARRGGAGCDPYRQIALHCIYACRAVKGPRLATSCCTLGNRTRTDKEDHSTIATEHALTTRVFVANQISAVPTAAMMTTAPPASIPAASYLFSTAPTSSATHAEIPTSWASMAPFPFNHGTGFYSLLLSLSLV